MKNKCVLVLLLVMTGVSTFAQSIFINRDFWAIKPSIELIKQKMAEGNNILEMGPGGWDGLMWSIMENNDIETIKFVMNQPGIDFKSANLHHSNNYLMWTAYKANIPVMKLLLEKGSKTDIINSHGQSLLMHAAMSGKPDPALYDFCLQNGANFLTDKDTDGRNVMMTAIGYLKDVSFLNYFVSKGLTLKDTDNKGNGLFHYAVPSGNLQALKDLVAMGVSYAPNTAGENAFAFVGRSRSPKISAEYLQYLKSLGLDPKAASANGQTLAHTAATIGADASVFQFVTENGLNLAQTDKDGNTPLMLAASRGTAATVGLWAGKNDVNATNNLGKTALNNAVAYNSAEVVKMLIDKEAKANSKDKDGNDLYYTLVSSYRTSKTSMQRAGEIMDLLKGAGAIMPKNGKLLHTALNKDDKELMGKLIELGDDINAKDKDGYTLLHYTSMKSKNLDMLKFLIEKGANPQVKTELNESVADLIAENEVLGKQSLNLDFLKNEKRK